MEEKFEFTRMFVPLRYDRARSELLNSRGIKAVSINTEESDKVWAKAQEMGLQGWHLVSTVPCISSVFNEIGDIVLNYTNGYILIFQRRIQG